jgi:hypothetical protein
LEGLPVALAATAATVAHWVEAEAARLAEVRDSEKPPVSVKQLRWPVVDHRVSALQKPQVSLSASGLPLERKLSRL